MKKTPKKKIFPGVDTLEERKKFAIFHACTIIAAFVIGALLIFLMNWSESIKRAALMPVPIIMLSPKPFADVGKWLFMSLFVWNFLGSVRFAGDAYDAGGRFRGFIHGCTTFLYLFIFPFVYLYNLWCLVCKKAPRPSVRSEKKP